ncbi:hypothetical protein [Bullifex porci]|uniref:hypothetical protein n=1 Tax=Bullifex porci TaxID=2606638 RepID=UPI0023F35459|nr:hypothetical protein [Bullifex porci]MDD7254862.1 hypothetical protein [Bullifex porci]MDY2741137.1 hypothetical protein [Bullifex porci]
MNNSEEYFKNLNELTYELIEALIDDKIPNDGGNNMCRAIEQMKKHAFEEGYSQGKAKTLYELTRDGIITKETGANILNITVEKFEMDMKAYFAK